MVQPQSDAEATAETVVEDGENSWRDRALERSLRTAKAKAMSRSDRFIATAMEILQETGRTDFTVQELVERSRTSLRSFYQYFAGKDELLLALLEETITDSVSQWRDEIEGNSPLDALQVVVEKLYGQGTGQDPWMGLHRALASYHVGLVGAHSVEYRRALTPFVRLVGELLDKGIKDGSIRRDITVRTLVPVVMQIVIGASMMNSLNDEQHPASTDGAAMWEICRQGLVSNPAAPAARPKARSRR